MGTSLKLTLTAFGFEMSWSDDVAGELLAFFAANTLVLGFLGSREFAFMELKALTSDGADGTEECLASFLSGDALLFQLFYLYLLLLQQ